MVASWWWCGREESHGSRAPEAEGDDHGGDGVSGDGGSLEGEARKRWRRIWWWSGQVLLILRCGGAGGPGCVLVSTSSRCKNFMVVLCSIDEMRPGFYILPLHKGEVSLRPGCGVIFA